MSHGPFKIVEYKPGRFIVYEKQFGFWIQNSVCCDQYSEREYYFSSYENAVARIKVLAAIRKEKKSPRFKKKTYLFNERGENYTPTYYPPAP
jgi:hypothetical protein